MEVWKPIVGYEGYYEVSSLGRIRSLDREIHYVNGRVDHRKGQIKSVRPRKDGYLQFNVSKDSKKAVLHVHHVACEAFHGPRPAGMDVSHNNGIRDDNREANLRYDTRKGNLHDTLEHGTRAAGERHGASKLTSDAVAEITSTNTPSKILAVKFGVHRNHIARIRRGERWNSPALAA